MGPAMKRVAWFSLAAVLVVVVAACSSEPSNEETCEKFKKVCGSNTGGIGGSSATLAATCDPAEVGKYKNSSDVKECIDDTNDCNTAVGCIQGGQK